MTDEEMVSALTAKGYHIKSPVDQETCKHIGVRASGWAKSDGSSETNNYCPECGKRWTVKTEAMPQKPFDLSLQLRN